MNYLKLSIERRR